jgi:hypothetical protein
LDTPNLIVTTPQDVFVVVITTCPLHAINPRVFQQNVPFAVAIILEITEVAQLIRNSNLLYNKKKTLSLNQLM